MTTLAILCAAALAAPPAQDVKVAITDKGFMPVILEVEPGQKVIWTNATTADHTVTEGAKHSGLPQDEKSKPLFDSGRIKPGASFEFTFTRPGTYLYHCAKDASMTGKIVVKARP